jgi:hypothetical protein
MSKAGVVLFHDINVHEKDFGVWQLWQEMQLRYPTFEFKYGHGLGVAAVGREIPAALQNLLASPEMTKAISSYFFRLGEQVGVERDLAEGKKARNLLVEAEQYVAKIDQERLALKALGTTKDQEIEAKSQEIEAKNQQHTELEQYVAKIGQELLDLKALVKETDRQRQKFEADLDEATTYRQRANLNLHKLEAALAEARRKQKEVEERRVERFEQDRLKLISSLNRYEADLRALQATRTVKASRTLGYILKSPQRFKRSFGGSSIEGLIDRPSTGTIITKSLEVSGWAYSHKASIENIEIWLDDKQLGLAEYGLERPDVLAVRSWQRVTACGYSATIPISTIPPGRYKLIVRVRDSSNRQQNFTRSIRVR